MTRLGYEWIGLFLLIVMFLTVCLTALGLIRRIFNLDKSGGDFSFEEYIKGRVDLAQRLIFVLLLPTVLTMIGILIIIILN